MPDDLRIPIIQEEARVDKREVPVERVNMRTSTEEERVVIRDTVRRDHVELTRVPVDREIAEAPSVRTVGDVTVVPVVEERLVIEKRLFLTEELHLRRTIGSEAVELPTALRRTRVDVERTTIDQEKDH